MISVIIPVKDGGEDLRRCLDAIARQRVDEEVEVIVIDTDSQDGSRELARSRGARVIEIGAADFRHGATRNVAAAEAGGELLVFTTQDAYADDEHWLERLCASLRVDESLAGAYGRQIAHEGASPPERFFLDFLYGPRLRIQRAADPAELSLRTTLFSNANSAIRRAVWEQFPFADDMFFAEDQDWVRRVLLAGYGIRYEPLAVVRHSHSYTLAGAFKRFFDTGASAERGFLAGGSASSETLRREAARYAREELAWLVRTRQRRWIPYAAAYELAKFLGLQAGARHSELPVWLKRRWSSSPGYWEQEARDLGHADGAGYVPFNPRPHRSHQRLLALVGPAERVLDVGCSSGYLAERLQARGATVVGLDIDERAAAEARRFCESVHVGDVETMDLPFEPASFDVVLCGDVIEHLRDPQAFLERVRPLLKADGRLILSTPNVANWALRLSLLFGRFRYTERGILDRGHTYLFTRKTLKECLVGAGYRITKFDFTVPVPIAATPGVEALAHRIGRLRPPLFAYQFVVEAVPASAPATSPDRAPVPSAKSGRD